MAENSTFVFGLIAVAGVLMASNRVRFDVMSQVGPVAVFKQAVVVGRLPKTRSGKILRSTMRKIADREEFRVPATIEDPAVLDEIKTALQSIGYAG